MTSELDNFRSFYIHVHLFGLVFYDETNLKIERWIKINVSNRISVLIVFV